MARRAMVVIVEGIGCNMLGAYGGPWLPTPTLNASSIRSHVFDQFWLDSISLPQLYRSMWTGLHAMQHPCGGGESLASLAHRAGFSTYLASDSTEVWEIPGADEFELQARIATEVETEASRWEDSGMAQFFESALTQWLAAESPPSLIWLHCRGLRGAWDAPFDFRLEQRGEDDPIPPRGLQPPAGVGFTRDAHADELLGWAQSASAQVRILDEAWEWVASAIEEQSKRDEFLVIFAGLQGYPLGEHGIVGLESEILYAERTHCPLWIGVPNLPLGRRYGWFVQPSDLFATITSWLNVPNCDGGMRPWSSDLLQFERYRSVHDLPARHQVAMTRTSQGWSLQTPWWSGIRQGAAAGIAPGTGYSTLELFSMPDDRWQQNDVFRRARAIAEELENYQTTVAQWLTAASDESPLPAVPPSILERPR